MISLLVKLKILKPKNKHYGLVLLNLLFLTQEKIKLKGTLGANKKIKAMSEENVTGPVVVVGAGEVHHPDGSVERRERRSSFCRCGKSSSMPMCDGSHKN